MKLLLIACLSPKTGNYATAVRIRSHIEKAGHTCELRDAADFASSTDVANLVSQSPQFEGILVIHLFKAGRLLLDTQVPFGVIFGGTDINEDVKVEQKRVVMEQVLLRARFAVAFSDRLKEAAELFLRCQSSKIYVQPQGVQTEATEEFCWNEFLTSSGGSRSSKDGWGLPVPREEPAGAPRRREEKLRRGQQLHLRGHVGGHLGGHGSGGAGVGQGRTGKRRHRATGAHRAAVRNPSGICASISEAGVGRRAEREAGEEWEDLRGEAPQPDPGEGDLPAPGGHAALGLRSTGFVLSDELRGNISSQKRCVQFQRNNHHR
ncbi:glycosyltransferase 1 domain-containing protein 1 isoform X3 [Antennarius striatus]|uniref:glycosyltransferase 1 domain-containing protein 1 isoform X3 n=1 Tax=Antennarius striatus TaxID=241820 RepID=UPI0035AED103